MTEIEQAVASLKHLVECRCDEAYTGRGRHDPHSACDYADEVKIVVDHIEDLNAKLVKAVAALQFADDGANHGAMTSTYSEYALRYILRGIRERARTVLAELEKAE